MLSGEPGVGSRMFEPPQPLEQVAAEVNALLREAGVQLAVAEAGTGGAVAALLRASGALTRVQLFGSAEELAVALRVSAAKVQAFGAISAMVAAEAAAELIDTYEGGWGLVVMASSAGPGAVGNPEGGPGVQSAGATGRECFIALGAPSATIIQQCNAQHVAREVLDLLVRQARRRLKQTG